MKIKRPLINPIFKRQKKHDQLVFSQEFETTAIHKTIENTVNNINKLKTSLTQKGFDIFFWYIFQKFFRFISFTLFVIFILTQWNNINSEIPLFYNYVDNSYDIVTKELFFLWMMGNYFVWFLADLIIKYIPLPDKRAVNLFALILSTISIILITGNFQILIMSSNIQ